MSEKKRTKRAPRGYRIVLWADGFYHVYYGGVCIDETLSRFAGIFSAKQHAAQQSMHPTSETLRGLQALSAPQQLSAPEADSIPPTSR